LSAGKNVIGPGGVRYLVTPDVERFLCSMDHAALQSLVLEMAAYRPEAMRSHQPRATPEDEPTASELLAAVDLALAGVDLDSPDPSDAEDGGGRRCRLRVFHHRRVVTDDRRPWRVAPHMRTEMDPRRDSDGPPVRVASTS
jgi:hypothetical protein